MASDNEITPEQEERVREIVRDEEQKDLIRQNAVARELRMTNAILAVLARNMESQHRRAAREEPPTSYSYDWTRFGSDVADALLTLEEEVDP